MEVEGIYKEESTEGVDTYLSVLGVPWIARKVAAVAKPTIGINRILQSSSIAVTCSQRSRGLARTGVCIIKLNSSPTM